MADPFFAGAQPARLADRLPEWLRRTSAADLQALFKASLAVWVATLLLLIDPVLAAYGQATFFAALVLFFLPCTGVVLIQLLGGATMLLGMGVAWGWGTVASKAALAARPAAETQAQLALLAQTARQNAPNAGQASGQTAYSQVLVFEGFMLDARVSATFFGMVLPLIYLMARLRAMNPKAALIAVFAWIISDIYLTTAPLIPSFQGLIPQTILKPAATGVALGVVINMLVFPQSTSFVAFEAMVRVLEPMAGFWRAAAAELAEPGRPLNMAHLMRLQMRAFGAYQELQASGAFLALDTAFGRFSPADTKALMGDLRGVLIAFVDQIRFYRHRTDMRQRICATTSKDSDTEGEKPHFSKYGPPHLAEAYIELNEGLQSDESQKLIQESAQRLVEAGANDVLQNCEEAHAAILDAIKTVNGRRMWGRPSATQCAEQSERHAAVLLRLQQARKSFHDQCADRLLDPHPDLFDASGRLVYDSTAAQPTLLGVSLGLVLCERFVHMATVLEQMLSRVVELERTRVQSRLWLPGRLDHLVAWMFSASSVPGMAPSSEAAMYGDGEELTRQRTAATLADVKTHKTVDQDKTDDKVGQDKTDDKVGQDKTAAKKDKKKTPGPLDDIRQQGQRKRHPAAAFLLGLNHWLWNDEGIFALRVTIVSLALAIPAVIPSSAGFYYRERGLWALIMAQTGLVVYTSDFVHAVVVRISGTVLGGVIGMVCWYIGAGRGPGSAYGIAAVMVPVIVALMYVRLFGPAEMLQASILTAATVYLVVAYSWVDTHIPSYGNPGVGYSVFWRRMLLVIIGFSASMVVLLLPKPPSGSRRYRQQMAGTLSSALDLYVFWKREAAAPAELAAASGREVLQNMEVLVALAGPVALLRLEVSSTGFDAASLEQVRRLCIDVNLALATLLHVYAAAPADMDARFLQRTGALSSALMGDVVAVVSLAAASLRSGDAVPAVLPGPLLVRFATDAYGQRAAADAGDAALTRAVVVQAEFRQYCVMLAALVQLLAACDELVAAVKRAVGESHVLRV